jgi:hypothetical protein
LCTGGGKPQEEGQDFSLHLVLVFLEEGQLVAIKLVLPLVLFSFTKNLKNMPEEDLQQALQEGLEEGLEEALEEALEEGL